MSNMLQRTGNGGLRLTSDTVTDYPGLVPNPYPPTDYGTDNLIVSSGGYGTTGDDLADDLDLAATGASYGDPMPPENNLHDTIETDGLDDLKDWQRRQHPVNDELVDAYRSKYPTQLAGYPAVEPPV